MRVIDCAKGFRRLRSSIFFRLVWLSMALCAVLVAGLWLLTDTVIASTQENSAREAVDRDLAGLADIYASGGVIELQRRIDDRLALTPKGHAPTHYLLIDDDAGRLAGDIEQWPGLDASTSERAEIELGAEHSVFARATRLGPGLRLVVGQGVEDAHALRTRVLQAFLLGGFVFVIIVALAGRASAVHLRRRIVSINQTLQDSAERETITAAARQQDEIDQLAGDSRAVIARVQNLLAAHRDTTDRLAHEIRTPLMHLDTRLARAQESSPEPAIAERLVEARSEIRRLVSVLETLLDIAWSKARQGGGEGMAQTDLSAAVRRVCDLYSESAEDAGLNLVQEIAPGVTMVADEPHLVRVLTNLFDNAMKYVPQGGTVHVTLEPGPRLVVEDDGPGVPEAERERIFQRFHRGNGARSGGAKPGAGLGLALARAIAERHGLTLTCEAGARGARFVLGRGACA